MSIRSFGLIAAAVLLSAAAQPAATTGMSGSWRNTNDNVHLELKPCGQALCGVVTWASESQRAQARKGSGSDLVGKTLLRDLKPDASGAWRGQVYLPAVNKNASATVTQVDNKTLRIAGCAALGLICKTQHWHRLP